MNNGDKQMLDMNKITVGDSVGVASGGFNHRQYVIQKVTKINRWGHITLDSGRVFDKNGQERGVSRSYGKFLVSVERATAEEAARFEQTNRNKVAYEIKTIMEGLRNGYGHTTSPSAEVRNQLLELINKL
jgi:hypothetical protein